MRLQEIGLFSKHHDPVPLQEVTIDARLHDLLSEVTIEQHYVNEESLNIEATYTFPLPLNAVLLELTLEIGNRKLHGEVTAKDEAEEHYEDAIVDGDTALLLKKLEDGLYAMSLGNLQAGESAVIRFRYTELHQWQGDQLRFMIPTVVAERYGNPANAGLEPHEQPENNPLDEHRYQMSLLLSGILSDGNISSPTHALQSRSVGNGIVLSPSSREMFLDRDFVLNIERLPLMRQQASLVSAADPYMEGQHVALAMFQPVLTEPTNRHPVSLKIVIDCSGSMGGDSITQARRATESILEQLDEGDEFNIIRFGSSIDCFSHSMTSVSSRMIKKALSYISGIEADLGGTEIGTALRRAYHLTSQNCLSSDILLITDGEVWDNGQIIEQATESAHRIFSVGVGSAVSEAFVRNLAESTGGASELVSPNEDMAGRIVRHFQRIRSPEAVITLDWGLPSLQQSPETVGRVYAVDTVHAFATFKDPVTAGVMVNYLYEGKSQSIQQINFSKLPDHFTSDLLARLAAHSFVNNLDDEELETSIAVQYQLLTKRTGMTAIDQREPGQQASDLPELRKIPQMVAAGWGGAGGVMECKPMFSRRSGTDGFIPSSEGYKLQEKYLDIPAFLRTEGKSSHRTDTINHFGNELNDHYQSWAVINRLVGSWSIDLLEQLGLPYPVSNWLRTLITEDAPEKQIVILFLYEFIQVDTEIEINRTARRIIKKAYNALNIDREAHQQIRGYLVEITDDKWPDSQLMVSVGGAIQ